MMGDQVEGFVEGLIEKTRGKIGLETVFFF